MSAAQRREQLLDVAKAIVGDHGFHGISMESVARGAGISRPIVYDHFPTLGDLLVALLERETRRALAQLAAVLPEVGSEDRVGSLVVGLRGYLDAVAADPITWRLVLMPQEGAPEALHERIRGGRDAVVAALAEVVRPGLAPGRPSPDPVLTARLLSALADEAARLLLTDPAEYPVERLVAQARWLLGQLAGR